MASCDYCGTTLLFGGVRRGDLRFCNATCQQQGALLEVADRVPAEVLSRHVRQAYEGNCPKCNGPGPVDVHTSHTVWSALVMTSWRSKPEVCCRACGNKAKIGAAVSSAVLGWWGFPWGFIVTPIQLLRNAGGLIASSASSKPSAQLERIVSLNIASSVVEKKRGQDELA